MENIIKNDQKKTKPKEEFNQYHVIFIKAYHSFNSIIFVFINEIGNHEFGKY